MSANTVQVLNSSPQLPQDLLAAVLRLDNSEIDRLVAEGANVHAKDDATGSSLLHWAASVDENDQRQVETMRHLVTQYKVDIQVRDNDGNTVLHTAAVHGRKAAIAYLVESGIDVNSVGAHGYTPLHLAAWKGHIDSVKVLVQNGANIYSKAQGGRTAQKFATEYGHATVNSYLGSQRLLNAVCKGDIAEVKSSIAEGAEVPTNIIHCAAKHNKVAMIKYFLLEREMDVDSRNPQGETPLHVAACYGCEEASTFLLLHKANPNNIDNNGFTPLHWAAIKDHENIVLLLLNYAFVDRQYVDIDYCDKEKHTPLYLAIINGREKVARTLIDNGANMSYLLHRAAYDDQVGIVIEAVREIKFFIDFPDPFKQTPLHIAAERGHLAAIKTLLKCGAKINECDNKGYTPLHIAAERGHLAAIKTLLKCGAKINECDNKGYTPLDRAIGKQHEEIEQYLLKKGARSGKGTVNSISLYLHRHQKVLYQRGFALVLLAALFLSEIKLILLMNSADSFATSSEQENAIALPQNITQENAEPKIETANEIVCELKFDSENIPILACYDSQREFLTHVFVKETLPETTTIKDEYATPPSVETAVSIHVTTSSTAAHEHELSGDIYDLNTCKQIEYFGHKALHCEGNKTHLFTRMVKKSDPLDVSNILNTVNSSLLLGLFGVLLIKFLYNQYITTPENTDKKPDIILIAENDPDIQNFFQRDISHDKGNSEGDPFPDLVVHANDAAVQHFFKIAEEKLQQIGEMIPRIRDDEGPLWPLSVFFQPRNCWIKNSILSIRESLDDLKTERQIPKSDLYHIARDIYDLETSAKSNEPERPPSAFTSLSTATSLIPVIGLSP